MVGEGLAALDDDEIVDFVPGAVEADLEVVKLGVEHHQVVHLARLARVLGTEGLPAVLAAYVERVIIGGSPSGGGERVAVVAIAVGDAEDQPDDSEHGGYPYPAPELPRPARHGELVVMGREWGNLGRRLRKGKWMKC